MAVGAGDAQHTGIDQDTIRRTLEMGAGNHWLERRMLDRKAEPVAADIALKRAGMQARRALLSELGISERVLRNPVSWEMVPADARRAYEKRLPSALASARAAPTEVDRAVARAAAVADDKGDTEARDCVCSLPCGSRVGSSPHGRGNRERSRRPRAGTGLRQGVRGRYPLSPVASSVYHLRNHGSHDRRPAIAVIAATVERHRAQGHIRPPPEAGPRTVARAVGSLGRARSRPGHGPWPGRLVAMKEETRHKLEARLSELRQSEAIRFLAVADDVGLFDTCRDPG